MFVFTQMKPEIRKTYLDSLSTQKALHSSASDFGWANCPIASNHLQNLTNLL